MIETKTAKLFKNGASQAVRLPMEFRFDGDEVYVRRDEVTGDVILSQHAGANAWQEYFALSRSLGGPDQHDDDYMKERPMNVISNRPSVFADEQE